MHFINKKDHILSNQEILANIYNIKDTDLSKNDRSRIAHGIERLRKQLNAFNDIQIVLLRSLGYQLKIKTTTETLPEQLDSDKKNRLPISQTNNSRISSYFYYGAPRQYLDADVPVPLLRYAEMLQLNIHGPRHASVSNLQLS